METYTAIKMNTEDIYALMGSDFRETRLLKKAKSKRANSVSYILYKEENNKTYILSAFKRKHGDQPENNEADCLQEVRRYRAEICERN